MSKEERITKWVHLVLAIGTSLVALTAYAFVTFETKEHASEIKSDIVSRLDRIESKLDHILKK